MSVPVAKDFLVDQEERVAEFPLKAARLSDSLFWGDRFTFRSFAALPSNIRAIESVLTFANGLANQVAIVGPSGWGKTHLIHAAMETLRRQSGQRVRIYTAANFATKPPRMEVFEPLVLDDMQEVLARPRLRQSMRMMLERRVRAGRPTLLTFSAGRITRPLRSFLPYLREWNLAQIVEPDALEREIVIRHMAGLFGLQLSPIVTRVIARKIHGNARSIEGVLHRLRLIRQQWLSDRDVLSSLGVLEPYMSDSGAWELRDHLYDAILRIAPQCESGAVSVSDVAAYLMMRRVGICEREVADYFRLAPGEAHRKVGTIQELELDEQGICILRLGEQAILDSLETI
ncbi:MAG: Chromosomal replication initiator protein DnaA [Fimbriimonadaceae bacterium]|nr:Chromosomal replication initiator protein DnaA [Fimbriimonadaceae bacterium]